MKTETRPKNTDADVGAIVLETLPRILESLHRIEDWLEEISLTGTAGVSRLSQLVTEAQKPKGGDHDAGSTP